MPRSTMIAPIPVSRDASLAEQAICHNRSAWLVLQGLWHRTLALGIRKGTVMCSRPSNRGCSGVTFHSAVQAPAVTCFRQTQAGRSRATLVQNISSASMVHEEQLPGTSQPLLGAAAAAAGGAGAGGA